MDFVVRVEHLPSPGETVLGSGFQTIPGGKGANQACAAGRLAGPGGITRMVGRVGHDVFGAQLRRSLAEAGVDAGHVKACAEPTGVALIWVDRAGQNSIVVASGANAALTAADIEESCEAYRAAACALFQLETPLATVAAALALARGEGARTILDPAPAQPLSSDLMRNADILTPNETEALMLLERTPAHLDRDDAEEVAAAVHRLGPRAVILKLGEQGCVYFDGARIIHSPGFAVQVCDTTAAGDTFAGALAVALSEQRDIEYALRFANAAAALSVTRMGAQASVPTRDEVDAFLAMQQ